MKIIILGAGQVGTTLAANLVSEDNDITLVDNESQHLQNLQDKHDLRVVKGSPSSPKILRDAGAADADLMVAVTASDETNMIACQLGYTLFNTPTRIARIRNAEYLREKDKLFNDENVPIDHLISPENLVTDEITRLIAYPGALQVAHFANNRISIVISLSSLTKFAASVVPTCPAPKMIIFILFSPQPKVGCQFQLNLDRTLMPQYGDK